MQVTVGSRIVIENPTPEVLRWCKENLVLTNPDYIKKVRMNFWVGNTPERLYLYEIDDNIVYLPFGTLRDVFPLLKGASFCEGFNEPVSVDYGNPVPLYPYQQKAIEEAVNGLYGILQSPAGSGKTQMGVAIVREYGRKALWLTHTKDLLLQSKNRAEQYMDKSLIGTIAEGKVEIGAGITFATVQTLCKLDLSRYRNEWDVIIVDECHRVAGTPTAMTQFFKVLNNLSARHKYGLSATVHRSDGMIKATHALLGRVIYTVPDEAVADRVMKVGIVPIETGVKIHRCCLNTDGTLNYAKLISYLSENSTRTAIISHNLQSEPERPSLILSDRLVHLELIMSTLPKRMYDKAVMISGKMTSKKGKAEREQAIEDMRTGKKKYLFATYSLAKEGLDIPCLERLYMATPQKDYAIVTQSIGRIARTCEGKEPPLCYDYIDDIQYLVKSWKKRCSIYKKNGCYFVGGNE